MSHVQIQCSTGICTVYGRLSYYPLLTTVFPDVTHDYRMLFPDASAYPLNPLPSIASPCASVSSLTTSLFCHLPHHPSLPSPPSPSSRSSPQTRPLSVKLSPLQSPHDSDPRHPPGPPLKGIAKHYPSLPALDDDNHSPPSGLLDRLD